MSTLHQRFEQLHCSPALFVLPNVWDAGGAALAQQLGASAVGTTSAAMAWSCGYPDGGALPEVALLQRVAEIVRVTSLPVTVDIEDGYSDDPQEVALRVARLVELGVVGINIEDGANSPALLEAKLQAIRHQLGARPLFINARTDVYLRGMAKGEQAVAMSIERLQGYARAGADGGFVPGIADLGEMAHIAGGQPLPVNVMWLPGMAGHDALAQAGARRLSAGPALSTLAWKAMTDGMQALLRDTISLPADAPGYAQLNAMFSAST